MNPSTDSQPRRAALPTYHYTEAESDLAHADWGCNCGPAALAMILCLKPNQVRAAIPGFDEKRYTNCSMMKAALDTLRVPHHRGPRRFSNYGLCRIQWGGPWCKPGPTPGHPVEVGKWGYRFSHWIASMGDDGQGHAILFDINGGWMPQSRWLETIVPLLTQGYPRADGLFYITHNLELDLPEPERIPAHVQPMYGICRICGCTDANCQQCVEKTGQPCEWADDSHTLCTACVANPGKLRNA